MLLAGQVATHLLMGVAPWAFGLAAHRPGPRADGHRAGPPRGRGRRARQSPCPLRRARCPRPPCSGPCPGGAVGAPSPAGPPPAPAHLRRRPPPRGAPPHRPRTLARPTGRGSSPRPARTRPLDRPTEALRPRGSALSSSARGITSRRADPRTRCTPAPPTPSTRRSAPGPPPSIRLDGVQARALRRACFAAAAITATLRAHAAAEVGLQLLQVAPALWAGLVSRSVRVGPRRPGFRARRPGGGRRRGCWRSRESPAPPRGGGAMGAQPSGRSSSPRLLADHRRRPPPRRPPPGLTLLLVRAERLLRGPSREHARPGRGAPSRERGPRRTAG